MSVRTDNVNLIVDINGNKAQKELFDLDKRAYELKEKIKGLTKGTQEYIAASQELTQVDAKMAKLRDQIGITGLTQRQLNDELRRLQQIKSYLTPGSEAFLSTQKRIEEVGARLKQVRAGTEEAGAAIKKAATEGATAWVRFKDIALGVITGNIVTEIGSGLWSRITGTITGAGKLSDSLADVQRVTGLTAEEVKKLNHSLSELDTRTSTSGLRDIAVIAGKLGVGKEDILQFAKATDKLGVALGDELGNAEQITTEMGKLINVYSKDGKVTGDAMMYIGNAIVHMANSGVATGPFLVDFTQRLGGLAKTAKLSLPDVLGLAAGLEETGQQSESASTAIVKVMGKIAEDVPKYAYIANMSVEDFSKTLREKPVEALIKVSEGLAKNKNSFEEISKAFADAGEDGARIVSVLGVIGAKSEFMRSKIDAANVSMQKQNEIEDAFHLKNTTLGASLDKLGKEINKVATSPALISFLTASVDKVSAFLTGIRNLPEWLSRNISLLLSLAAAYGLYQANTIRAAIATALQTGAEQKANVQRAAAAAWEAAVITQMGLRIIASDLLAGRISVGTALQRAYNLVLAANPVAAFIIALTTLGVALDQVYKNSKRVVELEQLKHKLDNSITAATNDLAKAQELYNGQIQNYAKLSETERSSLQRNIDLKIKDAEATLLQIEATEKKAMQDANAPTLWQHLGNVAMHGSIGSMVDDQVDAFKNQMEVAKEYGDRIDGVRKQIEALKNSKASLEEITHAEEKADALQAQTVSQLTEKMNYYRTALDNAAIGGDTYLRIQEKISATQKQLDAAGGGKGPAPLTEQEADKLRKEYEDLMHDIAALENKASEDQIAAINQRYSELTKRAEKYIGDVAELAAAEVRIEKAKAEEISKVLKSAGDKRRDELLSQAESLSLAQQEIDRQMYRDLAAIDTESVTDNSQVEDQLQREHLLRMINAYEVYGGDATQLRKQLSELDVKIYTKAENEKLKNTKQTNAAIISEEKKQSSETEKLHKHNIKLQQDELRAIGSVADSAFKIWENSYKRKEMRMEESTRKQIAALDRQLESGVISQKVHDEKVAAIQAASDKRSREFMMKQAKMQKAQAMFGAAINTALAVSQINANPAVNADFTQILRGILTGLVIATGVAEEIAIASEPLPQYYSGVDSSAAGWKWVGERGPELMWTPGGDTIHSADKSAELATYFAQTMMPKWYSATPQSLNVPLVQQGISLSRFGNNSISQQTPSAQYQTNTAANNAAHTDYKALVKLQEETNDLLRKFPKEMKAYFVYNEYQRNLDDIATIKTAAKLS